MWKLVPTKLPQPHDHRPPRQLVQPAAAFRLRSTAVINGIWQTFRPTAGLSRSGWRSDAFDAGSKIARQKSLVSGSAKALHDHLGGERRGLRAWHGISAWHLAVVLDKTLPDGFCFPSARIRCCGLCGFMPARRHPARVSWALMIRPGSGVTAMARSFVTWSNAALLICFLIGKWQQFRHGSPIAHPSGSFPGIVVADTARRQREAGLRPYR